MKILVACEFTGIVTKAFIEKGHDAMSCDLLPGEIDVPHYQGDVRDILHYGWDMMIAFPPCTYLSYVANMHGREYWNSLDRVQKREQAIDFVCLLWQAPIEKIAIENPLGVLDKEFRRHDQIIQPWMFGHKERKRTCLWLKNLPPLMSTLVGIDRKEYHMLQVGKDRASKRSRTFEGIAYAMAEQWGSE
jgi:hypothetical protein